MKSFGSLTNKTTLHYTKHDGSELHATKLWHTEILWLRNKSEPPTRMHCTAADATQLNPGGLKSTREYRTLLYWKEMAPINYQSPTR